MIIRNINIAKPFVKWAGGKSQLLDEIDRRLPKAVTNGDDFNYVEPFDLTATEYIKHEPRSVPRQGLRGITMQR